VTLGLLYEAEGKETNARQMFEKALEVNPSFAPAANNLAWLFLQGGESPDRALELAKTAKAGLPDDPYVADTLGLAYISKGFYPSAISALSEAAEKLPMNSTVFYHLGLAYWKNNEKEKAIDALEKALHMEKEFPEREKAEKLLEQIRTERT